MAERSADRVGVSRDLTGQRQSSVMSGSLEDPPVAFFESVHRAFHQAIAATGGGVERYYRIGGRTIRLHFAGTSLVPGITPAFEHLATAPTTAPDLTVCLWDTASTGVTPPPAPWGTGDRLARGEIRGFNNGRVRTAIHGAGEILSMLDVQRNLAIWWGRAPHPLPASTRGSPLLILLHWWMATNNLHVVHAGAVGRPTGGVLLVGRGGSGKSTTALACLHSSLSYVSDDYGLGSATGEPYAHSLYNSGKLEPHQLSRLPHLVDRIDSTDWASDEKVVLFVGRHYPHKVLPGFPVKAILIPRVTGGVHTSLRPASLMACMTALAPSTIFQLTGAARETFEVLAHLVRRLPAYHLDLGTTLEEIPAHIEGLLAES